MKQIAKTSGLAYLMIFIAGFYANFAVLESMIDINYPLYTVTNFINNHSQFGIGLLGFFVMLTFDVLLIYTLFYLTKSVNKNLSYIASFFRLLHAVFFSLGLLNLLKIYQITINATNNISLQNRVLELLSEFDKLWTVGLMFFGLHLIILGYLIIKSSFIPKTLGRLLLVAAIGYIVDGFLKLFFIDYDNYKNILSVVVIIPAVIGELSFTIWLIIQAYKSNSFKTLSTN